MFSFCFLASVRTPILLENPLLQYRKVLIWKTVSFLSLKNMSRRRSRVHELTHCLSIQSVPPCRHQAETQRAQIVLNRSQPGLLRSTCSASPVFGRTPNAGLKSARMVLTDVGTTKVAKERQAPLTDSIWHKTVLTWSESGNVGQLNGITVIGRESDLQKNVNPATL